MVLYGMTPEAQRERAPSVVVSLVSRVVMATGCAANSAGSIAYLLVNHYFSLMTLGQLRSLLEVAATGSVRAAAERLFVTQPAVSSQIAALQKELGVRLVTRDGRGLRLTTAGDVLAGYARRLLGLLEEAAVATTGAADPHPRLQRRHPRGARHRSRRHPALARRRRRRARPRLARPGAGPGDAAAPRLAPGGPRRRAARRDRAALRRAPARHRGLRGPARGGPAPGLAPMPGAR